MTQVGLKDLRENIEKYTKKIQQGEEFVVMRKSTPLFKISSIDNDNWEEVIDFTKLQKGGVDIDDLLTRL